MEAINQTILLTAAIFIPTLGAIVLAFWNKASEESMRVFALGTTVVTFIVTILIWREFDPAVAGMQMQTFYAWIPGWNINYHLGVDGISMPLVLLT